MPLPQPQSTNHARKTSTGTRSVLRRATAHCAWLAGLTFGASAGAAEADLDKPLPNVMLLVDTSGSMEFTNVSDVLPVCHPGNSAAVNDKSRWIELVEVMTGTVENYSCFAMDRSSSGFLSEYSISGNRPYDFDYVHPFHRIVSGSCTVGPGELPATAAPYAFPDLGVTTFAFSAPATVTRPVSFSGYTGCSGFHQASDGILDVFRDKVRFGLMTFDTHVDSGTGVDSAGHADWDDGIDGAWSYYLNDTPLAGRPANCSTDQVQEVGARNAAAPPWEGRMVAFGAPNASGSAIQAKNDQIQKVLLADRPYGATPIAGLMHDAREFFWNDTSSDPLDSSLTPADFGPADDPATKAPECRRNVIILLSDGEPNLDLRPYCENTAEGGHCPYDKPEEISFDLYNNPPNDPDQNVETYVVGFALSRVTPSGSPEIGCSELTDAHCAANPSDRAIQACCTLNKIAANGAPLNADGSVKKAYFPQNGKELRQALSRILSDVATSITTRTSTAYSNAASPGAGAVQFTSGFQPVVEQPWKGKLTRTRITCEDGVPEEQTVDAAAGDDFAANLNSGSGPARKFYTYIPETSGRNSIRPFLTGNPDGVGSEAGTQEGPHDANQLVDAVPAAIMEMSGSDCDANNATTCRDDILGWTVGLTNSEGEARCATPGDTECSLLGAIYHSTPRIVSGAPREYLRDESYERFARTQATSARPTVLYTATLDGMLHAFKVAPQTAIPTEEVNQQENNELWAYFPPAVLPVLKAQYPNTPASLLDGVLTVRDVSARVENGVETYSRTSADAQAGLGEWRTVLLSGFGTGQVSGGFFALDVTNPESAVGGPLFRWQLTRDGSANALFGSGGNPIITTIFLKASASDPGAEVAVAILPGGDLGTRTSTLTASGPLIQPIDDQTQFAPALQVASYTGATAARSLTVVRLDNGEVIRSFRSAYVGTLDNARTEIVNIPAPIVGQPAAFPGAVGSVADRIFVGDREGRVWRLDVSKGLPTEWTFEVFFDAFFDLDVTQRQPIVTAPILSVDDIGQITLAISTGDQGVLAATPGMLNRVVSLTETLDDTQDFRPKVNWVETLGCDGSCGSGESEGERVTGGMTLFGSALYFATSTPPEASNGQCASGSSRVWGLHYTHSLDYEAGADSIDPMSGAAGALPPASNSTTKVKSTTPSSGVVFGVSVEQQPSCSSEAETFEEDPYLGGYGSHSATSAVNPGKFFLVTQVGGASGSTSNSVATEKLELQPPRSTVNVDSWAPIFE
jgi:type IV pilus assembly protein PilY1